MSAKPWSPSHVATVASTYTDLRISGDVKSQLVDILVAKLDQVVPRMEQETLTQDAERKTLDDPQRTRLGYSRTRGLMTERIEQVDSVSAAAVTAACEELESYLRDVLRACETVCTNHRMGTIKPRHLEEALSNLGVSPTTQAEVITTPAVNGDDPLTALVGGGNGVITPATMRQMARSFAGMKVENDALEELLELYYDEAGELQHRLKKSLTGGNPAEIIPTLEKLDDLAKMGFLHRTLKTAGENAKASGARSITIEHILSLDV
jgi:histone H3/H4